MAGQQQILSSKVHSKLMYYSSIYSICVRQKREMTGPSPILPGKMTNKTTWQYDPLCKRSWRMAICLLQVLSFTFIYVDPNVPLPTKNCNILIYLPRQSTGWVSIWFWQSRRRWRWPPAGPVCCSWTEDRRRAAWHPDWPSLTPSLYIQSNGMESIKISKLIKKIVKKITWAGENEKESTSLCRHHDGPGNKRPSCELARLRLKRSSGWAWPSTERKPRDAPFGQTTHADAFC